MLIKKYLFIIFLFFTSCGNIFSSELIADETTNPSSASQSTMERNEINYSMRHVKSDLLYGTCIIGGCIVGAILTSLPQLEEAFSLFGEIGAMNIFNFYVKPIGIGVLAGGAIGCCAGGILKCKTLSDYEICPARRNNPTEEISEV